MKKLLENYAFLFLIVLFQSVNFTQVRNPVLEYCTGTWCQWCPCGHSIIKNQIKPAYPNVIVIGYHGPANGSDPFSFFPGNSIINALGFTGYPTGIVDRTSSPEGRIYWLNNVANRINIAPTVSITSSREFNQTTRELNLILNSKSLLGMTGTFYLSVILLEDSLIYSQAGNSSCPGSSVYVHNNVVRAMINGPSGEILVENKWEKDQIISKQIRYIIPADVKEKNASVVAFVYKAGNTLNTSEIQQAEKWMLSDSTATSTPIDFNPITEFELYQNYPNPFNPTTKISWQSPIGSWQTIKIYDVLGNEIATLVDEFREAGRYEIEFPNGESGLALSLPSGVYFYQLRIGNFISTRKMQFIK